MKVTMLAAATIIAFGANGFAASTLTGVISDSMCGASHDAMTEHGSKMTDKQCTAGCVQHGAKYVFVENGKVLQIANQNLKELPTVAGDKVQVTGDVKGDTITITKVEAAKK